MTNNEIAIKQERWTKELNEIKKRVKDNCVIREDKESMNNIRKGLQKISDFKRGQNSLGARIHAFKSPTKTINNFVRDGEKKIEREFKLIWNQLKDLKIEGE